MIDESAAIFLILCPTLTCSAAPGDERNTQEKAIEEHRKGSLHIKGKPGEMVKVEQLKHEFWFGCAISSHVFAEESKMSEADIAMYKKKFLENFNSAVTENADVGILGKSKLDKNLLFIPLGLVANTRFRGLPGFDF